MGSDQTRLSRTSHVAFPRRPRAFVIRFGQMIELAMTWYERSHQRRQLRALSDAMLRDIGRSRADAEAEATKPFWRP